MCPKIGGASIAFSDYEFDIIQCTLDYVLATGLCVSGTQK